MNESRLSLPEPAHISVPWEDSNCEKSSIRNSVRSCVSANEGLNCAVSKVSSEPRRERKRWTTTTSHILHIDNTRTEVLQEEKPHQYGDEEKYCSHNPVCIGDCRDHRVFEAMPRSSGCQHYHDTSLCKATILHEERDGKSSAPFQTDKSHIFYEQVQETIPESPVTGRIPSPSSVSSVTSSRRLEWDSGADVGYHFLQENPHSSATLSTIERIALVRGCSAALFERLDPEGFSGPPKPILSAHVLYDELDSPIAKSTPLFRTENKNNLKSGKKSSATPDVEPSETVLPGGYLYLHSGEEFENDVAPPANGSGEQSEGSPDDKKIPFTDNLHKQHSNSLINLSSSHEELPSSVPRSQSYLNLLKDDDVQHEEKNAYAVQHPYTLAAACSVSSSSVATIVQKPIFPKTSDKFIQTLPLKLSVGVQVSECIDNSDASQKVAEISHYSNLSAWSEIKNQKELIPIEGNGFPNSKCGGAHKKGSSVKHDCQNYHSENSELVNNNHSRKSTENSLKESKENYLKDEISTLEKVRDMLGSAASSSHTAESSCVADTPCSGVRIPREGHAGSFSVVDSANSFEYLPGHMFENAFKRSDSSKQSTESKSSVNKVHSKSSSATVNKNKKVDSHSSTMSKDLEEGVEILKKLMCEKSYNGKMKKQLIRQIVNKLVNSHYPEDDIDEEELQKLPLSSNVPWVPAIPNVFHLQNADSRNYVSEEEKDKKCSKFIKSSSSHSGSEGTKGRSAVDVTTSEIPSSFSTYTPSGSLSVPGDNEQSQPGTSEVSSNNVSENSKSDWKLPTSQTEKHFETNRRKVIKNEDPNPSLLHLCKSEHQKQLQWIRFEIDHLSHLKQLLEKQEKITKTVSNLADHKHKFHKIKTSDRKLIHKCLRSETNSCNHQPNSIECSSMIGSESNQGNNTLETDSSLQCNAREPLLSKSYHSSQISDKRAPRAKEQEKSMKMIQQKCTFSSQTPTLDSYILHNNKSANSHQECLLCHNTSGSNHGRLNVYVQTSPKALKKNEKMDESIPVTAKASVYAKSSYKSAVKCCCECRKALDELALLERGKTKEAVIKTFCKCKSERKNNEAEDNYLSFNQTDSGSQSYMAQSASSSNGHLHITQKSSTATETVVNKTVQTTPSLNEIPVRKVRNENKDVSSSEQKLEKDRVCPCCGLCEMPLSNEQLLSESKPRDVVVDDRSKHFDSGRGKGNPNCDASVQTSIKEPLAYLLSFEPTNEENVRTRSNDSLPEIKLYVPVSQNKLENELKKKTFHRNAYKENQCPSNNALSTHQRNIPSDRKLHDEEEEERKKQKLTLEEYLRANRPDYVQQADKRSQCLADLALLRDLRKQKRMELIAMTQQAENEKSTAAQTNERIIFTCSTVPSRSKYPSRVMREQSRRKYHKTREVQNKLVEKKKKEDFRTNRLMAELFTKKLQKKVLEGVVNHSNSASVISSIP